MRVKDVLIKTVSVFLFSLSVCGIYILLYLNNKSIGNILILSACIAAAFIFINFFVVCFSKKISNAILITASLIILLYGIAATPYNPCHDSLDLHNLLSYMLHNGNDMSEGIYIKTYMNFFINNKFVIYIYLPFVHLFKNVTLGVRFLNGALLIGTVFFTAFSVNKFIKKDCFSVSFFILSLIAPLILLSGPYIYLPSVFTASAVMLCYVCGKKVLKILFFVLAAALFALRPTCFGFVIVFIIMDILFKYENKKEFLKKAGALILVLVFSFVFRSIFGTVLYYTGIHPYPDMQNAAGIWTLELGTRINGEETGTCFYTPFTYDTNEDYDIENDKETDDIQKCFFRLWKYYRSDVKYNTDNYENISALQNTLRKKIAERTLGRTPAQFCEHFYFKTVNFYKDSYIPYYYKANLNDENIKIWKNYDKKYFAYLNMIFLLFFLSMVINFIRAILNRDKTNGVITAFGISAMAVNIVFLLFLEVQKKYMFDFYIPMVMCIAMTFAFDIKKKINKPAAALITAALVSAFVFNENLYDIKIFKNAETSIIENGEENIFNVKMKEVCTDEKYYIYNTYDGEKIYLYGRNEFSVTFNPKSLDAFILYEGDDGIKRFSAQIIKE